MAVNPALAVSPPRPDRPELIVPNAAAVRQILEAAEGPLRTALLLAASTGMRRGEVLGSAGRPSTVRGCTSTRACNA